MDWIDRLGSLFVRGPKLPLSAAQKQRLDAWRALPAVSLDAPHYATRYVVADVEASGLHMLRDRLISIGAVGVGDGLIANDDAFEVILKQHQVSDTANILLHGIGGSAQRDGIDPADALLMFLEYCGKSPLVAFHAVFDQSMIERAMKEFLGIRFDQPWIDLAWVMPELFKNVQPGVQTTLDIWLDRFGIENFARHNAVADSYATAKLLQIGLAAANMKGADTPAALMDIEKGRRWRLRSG